MNIMRMVWRPKHAPKTAKQRGHATDSRLRQTANVNLYHVTKFSPYFSFTVYCFYTKISSFMPVLSKRIVLDCFYLLIFYFEKFSTDVCRLPCAVNVNLNLSINFSLPSLHDTT